jgi:hypothetical protein
MNNTAKNGSATVLIDLSLKSRILGDIIVCLIYYSFIKVNVVTKNNIDLIGIGYLLLMTNGISACCWHGSAHPDWIKV